METTTKSPAIEISIKATGESLQFTDSNSAIEFLIDAEILPESLRATKNSFLALNSAVSSGLITVNFAPNKDEDRPKLELKAEKPAPKPAPKIEFTEYSEIKPEEPKVKPFKAPQPTDKAAQLVALMNEMLTPNSTPIDPQQVREIVKEELRKQEPKEIIYKIQLGLGGKIKQIEGLHHENLPELIQLCALRLNVWLYGPSGSGKTHAAQQVGENLNLPVYCVSVCSQSTKTDLIGYQDANGRYIETVFYKAFKDGGIFLLDEIDNGNPNILNVLNSALSNGFMTFGSETVKKHVDFICIAGANTIGNGGNIQYVGRNPIDGASKNRFKYLYWGYDEALEYKLNPAPSTKKVQELRKKADKLGIKAIISPRDSADIFTMINAGISEEKALNYSIFNKLSADEAKLLKS